ncbi:MAG: hypothetical protein ABJB66_11265 [Gemmatimonadaceae bacterium]
MIVVGSQFAKLIVAVPAEPGLTQQTAPTSPDFPKQDRTLVQEMVGVSHNNIARVREILELRPALAKAGIDWGFGDWETAIDAASHVGNREIAELLIAHGARPTMFTAAMLGQLDVVRALISASPGIQHTKGPHSITLLAHAKAGGERALAVRQYLESVGGADEFTPVVALTPNERASFAGIFSFGSGVTERLEVLVEKETLLVRRGDSSKRGLRYLGNNEFHPTGAEMVRIRFSIENGVATKFAVYEPDLTAIGNRVTS